MQDRLSDRGRRFLQEGLKFAVLATINPDGTPQLSTMWYELRDGHILMNTRRGRRKDRNMRRESRVTICVEDGYRYLTIHGTVQLIDDQEIAQRDIKHLSERYHGPQTAERQARDQFGTEVRVTIHMSIDRVDEYALD